MELITAVLPDVDAKELRERLGSKKGFVWVKRQVTQKEQRGNLPPRTSRRRLPAREQARLSQRTARRARHRLRRQGQRRHRRDGEVPRSSKASPIRMSPASPSIADALKPVRLSLDLKATHALRDELARGSARFRAKAAAGAIMDVNTGEIIALESLPDFDPNDPGDVKDPDEDQSRQRRRLRNGLDVQGAFARDGARFGQGQPRFAHRRARKLALWTFHHSRFPRHPSRAHRPRGLHPFLEHRRGAHGADGRRRRASGVLEENGTARSAAHGIAGKRRAARARSAGAN